MTLLIVRFDLQCEPISNHRTLLYTTVWNNPTRWKPLIKTTPTCENSFMNYSVPHQRDNARPECTKSPKCFRLAHIPAIERSPFAPTWYSNAFGRNSSDCDPSTAGIHPGGHLPWTTNFYLQSAVSRDLAPFIMRSRFEVCLDSFDISAQPINNKHLNAPSDWIFVVLGSVRVKLDNGNLWFVYVYTVGFYTACKVLSQAVERFRTRESAETLATTTMTTTTTETIRKCRWVGELRFFSLHSLLYNCASNPPVWVRTERIEWNLSRVLSRSRRKAMHETVFFLLSELPDGEFVLIWFSVRRLNYWQVHVREQSKNKSNQFKLREK